jgi:hypothetical protein
MEFRDIISFEGGINTDDTPQGVPKGDYRDFSYCRLGYNSGNAYAVETSDGTLVIPESSIGVGDQIMGATQWLKRNSIVYFVFKANLVHEIWFYDIDSQSHSLIIQSTELNFSRDWPIFHANVVDDILKWTDGRWDDQMYEADGTRLFNPPYQINIQKAIDSFYTNITLQTIDAIKWPMDPPLVTYFTDPTRNDNKLRNKLFKFIIQPIYENGEVGVWSMYSNLDLPEQSELVSGTNWIFPNNSNGIRIQFNTGLETLRKFNIAVQQFDKDNFGATPPFGVFLQLDKDQDVIPNNTIYSVDYYGGVSTIPAVDVFKNYDRLPIVADCQEYLPTNQLTYVNFREGYDKPTEEPFILDVSIGYDLNEVYWNPIGIQSLLEVEYSFTLFRFTNYIVEQAAPSFDSTVVFPFEQGMTFGYSNQTSQTILYTLSAQDIQIAQSLPTIYQRNASIMQAIGDSFASQIGISPGFVASGPSTGQIRYDATLSVFTPLYNKSVFVLRPTLASPSLKSGATHEFGIVYGDRAYRDSTVYTVDSMNLFVPWFYDIDRSGLSNVDNPFTITPRFTIDHVPPVWATKYWIVAKPATEISSFGQYTTNANPVQDDFGYYINSITLDTANNNRYKIAIDKYYVTQNLGATIHHEIKVGDKVRFIRRRPSGFTASTIPYLPYLELDVIGYESAGTGVDGRQVVYTNLFDTSLLQSELDGFLFGPLLEIYTPRPSTDDTGNIFVSTWKDVSEAIQIRNPHTENRAHGAPPLFYVFITGNGPYLFYINGDYSYLNGNNYNITIYNFDGTSTSVGTSVTFASYDQDLNITRLGLGLVATSSMAYVTFDSDPTATNTNEYQIVGGLVSSTPAQFSLDYGDVYVRQRNYQTGTLGLGAVNYYFIEDPHYSDYWSSNIHNDGRLRIEDQNARMTHRQATAIHSDSFIVGTQINGLSSFALDNTNIEDMNPLYGEVVRAYMSGREGKTLKCLQPRRENSIYIQYYPNEVGSDSTVRVSGKTFASWFDYKGLFGCSDAGATAILPNGSTMYFDNKSGVFIYSGGNGQMVVSEIDTDTSKDFKFRTKTKQLAASYNASSNPLVRTYVNETVGEVGFAFKFDTPLTGEIFSLFNPPADSRRLWEIRVSEYDYSSLFGQFIVIVHENGNVYSGIVDSITTAPIGPPYTIIGLDTGGPEAEDFGVPAYFYITSGVSYDHVVFDYVNMRWRSTYDYNFQQFCNLGQALVGWGVDNQLYLHNQYGEWNFHGQPFVQKVSFVSNVDPLLVKRYQQISLISDDVFSIEARSEPNRSYPRGMKTFMPRNIVGTYEGYGEVNYRKNLFDPRFFNSNNICFTSYDPPLQPVNGWEFNSDQSLLVNQNITILQTDGEVFTGRVATASYVVLTDTTLVTLVGLSPSTNGIQGQWYYSDIALLNGEDIRANALTHTLEYDPTINNTSSILVSVGIKGVLS